MSTTMMRRVAYLISLVAVLFALSLPAAASAGIVLATAETEQPADTEEAPAGADAPIPEDLPEPAVLIEPEAGSDAAPEWTFRFLIPTALVVGGLAVLGTIIAYFVKVTKARYRVVE